MTRAVYLLRRAGRLAVQRPRLAIWAIGAIAAALTAFAIVRIAATNVSRWTSSWRGAASMVVYFTPTATPARADEVAARLRATDGVETVELIAPAEAARRLRTALGGKDDLLAGVDDGALPLSLEITLAPGVRDVAAASPLVDALRATDGVEDVEVSGEWIDQVGAVLASLRAAAWALLVLLGAAAVWVVAATLRLRMESAGADAEARVARLLGAPPRFLRTPAILAGAIQGALGAGLALAAAWGLYRAFADRVVGSLAHVIDAPIAFLPAAQAALLVAAGAGLGVIGGALAGSRARA
jgi:cell division transport system permease protein